MKNFKQIILKSVAFVMIFLVLFFLAQEILREKTEYTEDLKWRYDSYKNQIEKGQDIDVVYMGSSPVYAAVSPMTIWQEKGFTGMNFGTSIQNIMSLYYCFNDILEYSTPKVLVIDFKDLHEARLADNMEYFYSYRKAYDTISDSSIKKEFVKDVIDTTGSIEFLFPITQFHDRWDDIGPADIIPPSSRYVECTRGALMSSKHAEVKLEGVYDEKVEPSQYNEFSLRYYNMLLDLCEEKGIEIIALIPPTAEIGKNMASQNAIKKYCTENNVPLLNYNSPELIEESGLDYKTDFYNNGHVNISGSVKISKSLAFYLDENFELTDHRGDSLYESWEKDLMEFNEKYIIKE